MATQIINNILSISARAPSGTITSLWKIYVITGQKQQEWISQVRTARIKSVKDPKCIAQYIETFAYNPKYKVFLFVLSVAMNIVASFMVDWGFKQAEKEKMAAQHRRSDQWLDVAWLFWSIFQCR